MHSSVVMERMVYELRGIPCIALEDAPPDRKMVIASRSFGQLVRDRHEMEEAVTTSPRARPRSCGARTWPAGRLAVFVTTDEHRLKDPQYAGERAYNLPVATADTGRLNRRPLTALDRLWRPGFSYKKAGVTMVRPGAGRVCAGLSLSTGRTMPAQSRGCRRSTR